LAVEFAVVEKLPDPIGLCECRATNADNADAAIANIRRCRLGEELLQVAVSRADEREIWVRTLNSLGCLEVSIDANEWMLGRLVAVRRRSLERPAEMRLSIRVAHRRIHE